MQRASDLVGETPLVELHWLSQLTGRTVMAKMESMSVGGSVKDRAAAGLVREALKAGAKEIVEATAGSTGTLL